MSNNFDPDRDPEKLLNGIKASNESNWFSGGTAHILPAERKKATFEHDAMTFIIDGSPKITMKKRWIYESNTKDELDVEELGDSRKYDLERREPLESD